MCQDGVFDIIRETIIMIKGLRTLVYPVADLAAAKEWYANCLLYTSLSPRDS